MTEITYTDRNGLEVNVGDILKYDEGEGYGQCVDVVVMDNGVMSGKSVVFRNFKDDWVLTADDKPISLEYYCNSGTTLNDSKVVGNVKDNPEMLTVEYAKFLFEGGPQPEGLPDDDDEPKSFKELAEACIADMERYAEDELPHRRMVSFRAYKERFDLLSKLEESENG